MFRIDPIAGEGLYLRMCALSEDMMAGMRSGVWGMQTVRRKSESERLSADAAEMVREVPWHASASRPNGALGEGSGGVAARHVDVSEDGVEPSSNGVVSQAVRDDAGDGEVEEKLGVSQSSKYRAVAGGVNCYGVDRPDLQHEVKRHVGEWLHRGFGSDGGQADRPLPSDGPAGRSHDRGRVRRGGRHPRICGLRLGRVQSQLEERQRSVLTVGGMAIKTWRSTQSIVATSRALSEFRGVLRRVKILLVASWWRLLGRRR